MGFCDGDNLGVVITGIFALLPRLLAAAAACGGPAKGHNRVRRGPKAVLQPRDDRPEVHLEPRHVLHRAGRACHKLAPDHVCQAQQRLSRERAVAVQCPRLLSSCLLLRVLGCAG